MRFHERWGSYFSDSKFAVFMVFSFEEFILRPLSNYLTFEHESPHFNLLCVQEQSQDFFEYFFTYVCGFHSLLCFDNVSWNELLCFDFSAET